MNFKILIGIMFVIAIVACAPDTLQSTYEKYQKDVGNYGWNIIHIAEHDDYGLVLATIWSEQDKEDKGKASILAFIKENDKWVVWMGADCDGLQVTQVIGGGNYLYCGAITDNRPNVEIMVGETAAQVIDVNDQKRVWYAVEKSMGMKVRGK